MTLHQSHLCGSSSSASALSCADDDFGDGGAGLANADNLPAAKSREVEVQGSLSPDSGDFVESCCGGVVGGSCTVVGADRCGVVDAGCCGVVDVGFSDVDSDGCGAITVTLSDLSTLNGDVGGV